MITKQYTFEFNTSKIEHNPTENRFTPEERASLIKNDTFQNREDYIFKYLNKNHSKLAVIDEMVKFIKERNIKSILSIGAGPCILEAILKTQLPKDVQITATDFDPASIENAKKYLPELRIQHFDFFEKNLCSLYKEKEFDCVICFGSTYILDNNELTQLLKDFQQLKIPYFIDHFLGILPTHIVFIRKHLPFLAENRLIRFLLRRPPRKGIKKWHGFNRNKSDLERIYKTLNIKILKRFSGGCYHNSLNLEL